MITLIDVSKTFNPGTITEKRAVKKTNLKLAEGDFVTVIGGNGAGKSTLLNLIAGVYEADTGSIILDGVDVTKKKEHERAGFLGRVFQDPMMGTAADMAIEENLALAYRRGQKRGLRWYVTKAEREMYYKRLETLDLGLETRLHSKVGLLSGGQRQALTLLMATLKKPKLLLLDEHTAALDPKTAAKVLELTESIIAGEGLTAFMVTHNMRHAIRYGNRLIMMTDGMIIYEVSGEEKKGLEVSDLLKKFEQAGGGASDRMILSGVEAQ
jgi:putative ABC transport system ATP-binding protein